MIKDLNQYTQYGDVKVKLSAYNAKLLPEDANGCIDWRGPFHPQGYGMFAGLRVGDHKRIMMTAHRLTMKMIVNRPLANNEFVIHTCSNFKCQNPDHLILGDASMRNKVMHANGRAPKPVPGRRRDDRKQNRNYRYTDEEMIWIRHAHAHDIAAKYNLPVKRAQTLRAVMRGNYRWLDEIEDKYFSKLRAES